MSTDEVNAEIARLYRAHRSCPEVSRQLKVLHSINMCRATVYYRLRRMKSLLVPRSIGAAERREIVRLYRIYRSMLRVSTAVGLSLSTIARQLHIAGEPVLKRGQLRDHCIDCDRPSGKALRCDRCRLRRNADLKRETYRPRRRRTPRYMRIYRLVARGVNTSGLITAMTNIPQHTVSNELSRLRRTGALEVVGSRRIKSRGAQHVYAVTGKDPRALYRDFYADRLVAVVKKSGLPTVNSADQARCFHAVTP